MLQRETEREMKRKRRVREQGCDRAPQTNSASINAESNKRTCTTHLDTGGMNPNANLRKGPFNVKGRAQHALKRKVRTAREKVGRCVCVRGGENLDERVHSPLMFSLRMEMMRRKPCRSARS